MVRSLFAAVSSALLVAAILMLSAPSADAQRRLGGMGGMGGMGGGGGGGGGGHCPRGYDACFNHCLEMGGVGSRTPAAGCARRCGNVCTGGGTHEGPHDSGKGHH
jgi:hypothetical protein